MKSWSLSSFFETAINGIRSNGFSSLQLYIAWGWLENRMHQMQVRIRFMEPYMRSEIKTGFLLVSNMLDIWATLHFIVPV